MGKKGKETNGWFVGYAPRRNPEIVVSVLIEEGEHGGAVAGPVARDIIKTYYDKKNKKNQGQLTVEYQHYDFDRGDDKPTAEESKVAKKQEETAASVEAKAAKKAIPE